MNVFDQRIVPLSIFLILLQAELPAPAVALIAPRPSFDWRRSATSSRHHCNDLCTSLFSTHNKLVQRPHRQGRHILHIAPQQLGEFEPINVDDANDEEGRRMTRNQRRVWLYDFVTTTQQQSSTDPKTMPYHEAWDFQKSLVEHQLSRIGKRPTDPPLYDQFVPASLDFNNEKDGNSEANKKIPPFLLGCDSIIMLQHDPVYTLGTASDTSFIRGYDENDTNDNAIPIVRIERGGEVTYHGPGQLTVYPILDLRGYKQDIHWYMRALEEAILLALDKAGVKGATREDNLTGVWVSNKKIAALGIKARRWVTMHGLAINVDIRSLQNFEGIVPCGLEGRVVTCINDEIGGVPHFTVEDFAVHVKEALEEIFEISLVSTPSSKLH
mmetsp:Transcript_23306/g.41770  ORF Transcript_23306/g.41770 Transcript_23306/m.41770 type:complete len:383 (+) Transcript_23306:43-1191(+)